jgi:hypothetical protein
MVGAWLLFRTPYRAAVVPPAPVAKPSPVRIVPINQAIEPRQSGYDPARLVREERAHVSEIHDVEASQGGDEPWARAVESRLGPQMQDDLAAVFPGIRIGIKCEVTTCRIHWDGYIEGGHMVLNTLMALSYLGAAFNEDGADAVTVVYAGGPLPPAGHADELTAFVLAHRAAALADLRVGRFHAPYHLPTPEHWPEP